MKTTKTNAASHDARKKLISRQIPPNFSHPIIQNFNLPLSPNPPPSSPSPQKNKKQLTQPYLPTALPLLPYPQIRAAAIHSLVVPLPLHQKNHHHIPLITIAPSTIKKPSHQTSPLLHKK